jgi:hypothetical protein
MVIQLKRIALYGETWRRFVGRNARSNDEREYPFVVRNATASQIQRFTVSAARQAAHVNR